MGYYIIIAEGITDCTLIEGILDKGLKYTIINNFNLLPDVWKGKSCVGKFPGENGELDRANSTPTFFIKDTVHIAVKQANGCNNFAKAVDTMLQVMLNSEGINELSGILIITDTDTKTREQIISKLKEDLLKEYGHQLNDRVMEVEGVKIKTDIYFIPNNGQGAVEKILLQCAEKLYPELYTVAQKYREELEKEDFKDFRKDNWATTEQIQSFYANKVHFGAISVALKPDKAMRQAIKDKIIRGGNIEELKTIEEFKKLYEFLEGFLI